MLNKLTARKSSPALNLIALALLVVALFAAGLKIGTLLTPAPAQPASAVMQPPPGAAVVNPPTPISDFTLTDQDGQPFSLGDLRGKVTLLFFGYTHCPEECPLTLANFTRVKAALGDAADEAAFVFISVDGDRDTPEVVRKYLAQFDTDFIGLTGDAAALRQVGANFGALFSYEKTDAAIEHDDDHEHHDAAHEPELDGQNYFVQHTSPAFLIDRDGTLRLVYFYGAAPDQLAEGARRLITE